MTATRTAELFLLEDLRDEGRTSGLAERDLAALRATAGWIESFVGEPNEELGRPGTVCPSSPGLSSERRSGSLRSRSTAGTSRRSPS
jgi:hypothetical protein